MLTQEQEQRILNYFKEKEEEIYETQLMKQIREERLKQFKPAVILRKKDGKEMRYARPE
jgi:hypothetical protein